jgi:hypothetical protein
MGFEVSAALGGIALRCCHMFGGRAAIAGSLASVADFLTGS